MLATNIIHYKIKIAISLLILSLLFQLQCTSGENKSDRENVGKQAALQTGNRSKKSDTTLILSQAKTNLKETIFIFEAKEKINTDSNTIGDFATSLNGRLKSLYQRTVYKDDIEITVSSNSSIPSYLHVKLYGNFDSAAVVQALNRKILPSDFVLSEVDTAVSGIRRQIQKLQKSNTTPLTAESNISYGEFRAGEIIIGVQKDTLAIKKLIRQITVPATKTLYLEKEMNLADVMPLRLYLVDKQPLITANELSNCSMQFDDRGYPGIGIILNGTGKKKLAAYTRQNIGRMLAIAIKGEIVSTPIITSEIPDGSLFLSGGMTMADGYQFLDKLGYPYPVPLNFIGYKK